MSSFVRVRLGGVNAKSGKFKGGKKEEDPDVDCGCDEDDEEEEEEEDCDCDCEDDEDDEDDEECGCQEGGAKKKKGGSPDVAKKPAANKSTPNKKGGNNVRVVSFPNRKAMFKAVNQDKEKEDEDIENKLGRARELPSENKRGDPTAKIVRRFGGVYVPRLLSHLKTRQN